MRNYIECAYENGGYEYKMEQLTNKVLVKNFFKCCDWIEDNCPNLKMQVKCKDNKEKWLRLEIENGKAYLECGDWGWDFQIALSRTETATFSRGSQQRNPHCFTDVFFFYNDLLVTFLKEWDITKQLILAERNRQNIVYSDNFTA